MNSLEEEVGSQSALPDLEVLDSNTRVRVPLGAQSTVDGQHDCTDKGTDDENLAARHPIGEGHTSKGADSRDDGVDQVQDELHVCVVANRLVDVEVEVSETVSGELTENTHQDDHPTGPSASFQTKKMSTHKKRQRAEWVLTSSE